MPGIYKAPSGSWRADRWTYQEPSKTGLIGTGPDVDLGFQRCSEIDCSESLYTRKQATFSKAYIFTRISWRNMTLISFISSVILQGAVLAPVLAYVLEEEISPQPVNLILLSPWLI